MEDKKGRRDLLKYLFSLAAFGAGSIYSFGKSRGSRTRQSGMMHPAVSVAQAMESSSSSTKRIAVEEHFATENILNYLASRVKAGAIYNSQRPSYEVGTQSMTLFKEKRLKDMDEAGIDMQVISPIRYVEYLVDPKEATALAKLSNEETHKIINKYPDRFAGFAVLPCLDPDAAAKELERAVKELGLKGALIYSHIQGEYLDAKKFWCIFETAEKLDVPIYLHPKEPSPAIIKPYSDYALEGPALGFGAEVALHAMRLIASGLFDRYSSLKMMLGHGGEGLPFWLRRMGMDAEKNIPSKNRDTGSTNQMSGSREIPLERSDSTSVSPFGGIVLCKKALGQYIKENFYVTTSSMFWEPVLLFLHSAMGPDRVLFSVDYPMGSNIEGVRMIESLTISEMDKEKIFHLNAEKIFKL